MNIANLAERVKPYFGVMTVILSLSILLGIWQLHVLSSAKTALKIVTINQSGGDATMGPSQTVVASKTGTKYYFPWCGALGRIKPENQVSFASPALAQAAGYQPAANCKGVK